jgi:hypothetical protein
MMRERRRHMPPGTALLTAWLAFGTVVGTALAQIAAPATADAAWKSKEINQWNEKDAWQILNNSPWAKTSKAMISRLETEDERRDGGRMGQDHGAGFDGVDPKGSTPTLLETIRGGVDTRRSSRPVTLTVRWESALPVRTAEFRTGAPELPMLRDDGYLIAVHGIPGGDLKGDPKSLGNPLKKEAVLRREGKKDVKPSSVEVFQLEDGLTVVYLFPPSAEITRKDGPVQFEAQIGRVQVLQVFDTTEMQFHGRLEL